MNHQPDKSHCIVPLDNIVVAMLENQNLGNTSLSAKWTFQFLSNVTLSFSSLPDCADAPNRYSSFVRSCLSLARNASDVDTLTKS